MKIADWFSGGVADVVDSVSSGLDKLFTSDEERLVAKNVLAQVKTNAKLKEKEMELMYEAELTKRNKDDQQNGNFLTKSARPIFLYWIMFINTTIIFGGMADLQVNNSYIDMIQGLSMAAVTFFFGSKGFEIYKHGKVI